jgi:hypothetical protein
MSDERTMIAIEWTGSGDLGSALLKPIIGISMLEVANRPNVVTLHFVDGTAIRVCSKMHELGPRCEVGSLVFSCSPEVTKNVVTFDLSREPLRPSKVLKLRIDESGVQIDSGVIIECEGNRRVIIVAGVYPYSLAVDGLFTRAHVFEPEYPLEKYQRIA